jgi:KDO2-lipid IV(A) lauroyltransferase
VPIACVRVPGRGYRLIIKPEISFEASGDSERDIYDLTLLCSQAVERMIDEYKSQWIWIHNRWCAKPPESA